MPVPTESPTAATRVGVDGRKLPEGALPGALGRLDLAAELGLEGVFFRSLFEMSPTLDSGQLAEIRSHADGLGLYLETGVGKVNPYASPETPEVRALGDGDYLLGMRRMLEAAARIGCTELWTGTANYKFDYAGYYKFDRFRTDITWSEQLEATARVLGRLAPALRDLGCRLNLETHEEITSFEVVRLVEQVGADVVGITFDTGNVLVRCEDPVRAAERVAPYTHMAHVKDAGLHFTPYGIGHQLVPCGQGVIDWAELLAALVAQAPHVHLSIENPQLRYEMPLHVFSRDWQAAHPDLTVAEYARVIQLTREYEAATSSGDAVDLDALIGTPCGRPEQLDYITSSARFLRKILPEAHARAAEAGQ